MLDFKKITIVLFLLLLLSAGGLFYFYKMYSEVKSGTGSNVINKTQEEKTEEEIAEIVSKVGLLMILPQDEEPTLATVSAPEKLRDQAFFANAVVGDKVLIYAKSGKAILYSPSKNKIIEVSPINVGEDATNTDVSKVATTTMATTTKKKI